MHIVGLEENFFLCKNDIWVEVQGEYLELSKLFLRVTRVDTNESLEFTFTADLHGVVSFNVSTIIHSLMPIPNHHYSPLNTVQKFQLYFKGQFSNGEEKEETMDKYFVLGGRSKNTVVPGSLYGYLYTPPFLINGESLVINKFVKWKGINLPFSKPYMLGKKNIEQTINPFIEKELTPVCKENFKAVKFRNSLGGYQNWVFDKYEIKTKTKAGKVVQRQETHRNLPTEINRTIEMFTKTPAEFQDIIEDLIISDEVYLYVKIGNGWRYERLIVEDNETVFNNWDFCYHNKITFSFNNLIKR